MSNHNTDDNFSIGFFIGAILMSVFIIIVMMQTHTISSDEIYNKSAVCQQFNSQLKEVYMDGDFTCFDGNFFHKSVGIK